MATPATAPSHDMQPDPVTVRRRGTGLRLYDQALSFGGYTLFTPQTGNGAVYLIDIEGKVVHQWNMPVRPGREGVLLPNGNLGYNGCHPTSLGLYPAWDLWHGGDFYEVTPTGETVWRHEDPRHHHDAQWLPNGNLLYTVCEPLPAEFARRITGGDERKDADDGIIQADTVIEVDRNGDVVWQWRSWDHLAPEDYPIHVIFDRRHWPLINGLYDTGDGLVLMSLRVTSGIIAVRRDTGEIAWQIGPDILAQQHSPALTPTGTLLAFDNGNLRKGSTSPHSRIVEIAPQTGEILWQYADTCTPAFFTPYMGGCQLLDNGNVLICESAFGRLFEVTRTGQTVWEYVIPFFDAYPPAVRAYSDGMHNGAFRAYRYSANQIPWLSGTN